MDGPAHDRILDILEEDVQFDWAAATSVSSGFALGSAALAVLGRLADAERSGAEFAPRQVLRSIFAAARHDRKHGKKAFFEVSGTENPFGGPDADAAWDAAVLAAGDGFGGAVGASGSSSSGATSSSTFQETYSRVVRGIISGVLCAKGNGSVSEVSPLCLDVAIFAAETLNGTDAARTFARELGEIRTAFRDAVPAENELRAAALASLAGIAGGEIHEGAVAYHFPGNKVDAARKAVKTALRKIVQAGFKATKIPDVGGDPNDWRSAVAPDLERRALELVDLETLVPIPTMPTAHDASAYEVQPDVSMFETDTEPLKKPASQRQANMSMADEVLSDTLPQLLRKVAVPMFRRAYEKLVGGWDWDAWPCDCRDNIPFKEGRCKRCDALFPRIVEMHKNFDPARAEATRGAARTAINMGLSSSASRLWGDPDRGPFEIAKLFMGNLGATGLAKQSFNDSDLAGLINLMTWCRVFAAAHINTKNVQEIRNTLIGHKAAQELATPQLLKVLDEAMSLADSVVFDLVGCTLKVFFFFSLSV
jgi:hypothetical protein